MRAGGAAAWLVLALGCARPAPDLLGGVRGLDHVGIAVGDLAAAQRTFTAGLGFSRPVAGRLPNGIANVNYYFEDATYLETLTAYDRERAPWLGWFLDRYQEGGNFAVLSVASAADTAAFLGRRGFATEPPSAGRIEVAGRPGGAWRTLFFTQSPLAGSPLYFIEYPAQERQVFLKKLQDPAVRSRNFYHRNGAVGLRAVWVAVPDLASAVASYAAIGLPIDGDRGFDSAALDARGQIVRAGRGAIVLLSPRPGAGPVRRFLDRRGAGVLGVSVLVRSLDSAVLVAQQGTGAALTRYAGPFGPSALVPASAAHGLYLEFVQP